MSDLPEIIDRKFEEAFDSWAQGANSIIFSTAVIGTPNGVIALDSDAGPDSRCLLARHGPDAPGVELNDADVLVWGVEIPRMEGDRRIFEDLPIDAIKGHLFYICKLGEEISINADDIRPDWSSLEGLGLALSQLRVVREIPSELHD